MAIGMPTDLDRWQKENSPELARTQSRIREEFQKWFAKGYAAVSFRREPGNEAYLLAPWSDF